MWIDSEVIPSRIPYYYKRNKFVSNGARASFREQMEMHSVNFNARIVGGDQLAAAADLFDIAQLESSSGNTKLSQRFLAEGRRMRMLGKYNIEQGLRFSPSEKQLRRQLTPNELS